MPKDNEQNQDNNERESISKFVSAYNSLCREHGYYIDVSPSWRYSQETKDWRLTLIASVKRIRTNVETE